MTLRRGLWIVAIVAVAAVVATLAVALVAGAGPAVALCPGEVQNYYALPEPAPGVRDGDVVRVGEERSVFVGAGPPLPADHRLEIRGPGVLDQGETSFAWTERRCGREVEGYRFVVVRAVAPGEATVIVPMPHVDDPRELRVTITP